MLSVTRPVAYGRPIPSLRPHCRRLWALLKKAAAVASSASRQLVADSVIDSAVGRQLFFNSQESGLG